MGSNKCIVTNRSASAVVDETNSFRAAGPVSSRFLFEDWKFEHDPFRSRFERHALISRGHVWDERRRVGVEVEAGPLGPG